jgi:hypothetical protein
VFNHKLVYPSTELRREKEKNLASHGFQNTLKKNRTSLASPKANCQRATLFASLKYAEKRTLFFAFSKITQKRRQAFSVVTNILSPLLFVS